MKRVRVDWHIHTTLSPCGSLSMDPATVIRKAGEMGLHVIGITDHNSTRQAREIITGFNTGSLMVLAGAEVTTREEIHCLAFFENLVELDKFQKYLDAYLPAIANNPVLFGDQVVTDASGKIIHEEEKLLISALSQTLEEVEKEVSFLNGIFIPAHINRPGFSLLSQLGMIPENLRADAIEWVPGCPGGLELNHSQVNHSFPVVFSSDAHRPEDIGRRFTEMEISESDFNGIRRGLAGLSAREKK